jgi:DNA helicase-2/ATP-dependent DNA helicase PcrA
MTPEVARQVTALAGSEIRDCLDASPARSFFLYAGAGSGKTRALVEALKWMQNQRRDALFGEGRRLAVITYTNAATDEITRRIEYDPFISVSTIHAFAWDLIAGFDDDIRSWLRTNLEREIDELMEAQSKGRAGRATLNRALSMQSKSVRLNAITTVKRFIYSPSGDNTGTAALNHAEVISMCSEFLRSKKTLRHILVNRFPVLFVDESQDTNRHLMDALLETQSAHSDSFCVGLFGDTMQRIYADGKVGLAEAIPESWAKPAKLVNFRCPQRVLRLINRIRAHADGQIQIPPEEGSKEGFVRFFIAGSGTADRVVCEKRAADKMAEITGVSSWSGICKTLILEHHMAATRIGFSELFEPLYKVDRYRTPLLDGSLPELNLFTSQVIQILDALRKDDGFRLAALLRVYSPILDSKASGGAGQQIQRLDEARRAIKELSSCFENDADPIIGTVLRTLKTTGLLEIPPTLQAALKAEERKPGNQEGIPEDGEIGAWDTVLRVNFSQVEKYASYIRGASLFGTHQGVKGLEFPHVMVIIDDSGARGFLFSYDKLFRLKAKSEADRKNETEGGDTAIDRTRRLLYVTCSRAQDSLAIVAYAENPSQLKTFVVSEGWFEEREVEILVS